MAHKKQLKIQLANCTIWAEKYTGYKESVINAIVMEHAGNRYSILDKYFAAKDFEAIKEALVAEEEEPDELKDLNLIRILCRIGIAFAFLGNFGPKMMARWLWLISIIATVLLAKIYETTVSAKSRNNRKIITKYQIELDSFLSKQLIVDQKVYCEIKKGDTIEIPTYQGLFGIPRSKTSVD